MALCKEDWQVNGRSSQGLMISVAFDRTDCQGIRSIRYDNLIGSVKGVGRTFVALRLALDELGIE
jgi:hypothetical protein